MKQKFKNSGEKNEENSNTVKFFTTIKFQNNLVIAKKKHFCDHVLNNVSKQVFKILYLFIDAI